MLCAYGLSLAQARSVASKVGMYFVTAAQKDIWQPHCDAQIVREHGLLVTQKAKTRGKVWAILPSHRIIVSPHRTHVSRTLAGSCCVCQLSLADHSVGVCPPLLLQAPLLADSMLQVYHRSLCMLPSIVNPCVAMGMLSW